MSKGKSRSKLSLSERRIRAMELFGRGYTDTDVARDLQVSRTTANNYRKAYEVSLAERVQERPDMLQDVLGNIVRQLDEYDDVRRLAWMNLGRKKAEITVVCDNCEHEMVYVWQEPPTDQATVQYLNTITKATEGRSKLLGLLGVKQEVFIEINNVNIVQTKIMAWLSDNLEGELRERLARFVETDLAQYLTASEEAPRPVLDRASVAALTSGRVPIPANAVDSAA